jgi:hypothetical protein
MRVEIDQSRHDEQPAHNVHFWRMGSVDPNKAKFSDGKNHSGRAVGNVRNDDRADWREAWATLRRRVRAPAREAPEIKGRGLPTRSSVGGSID